MKRISWLIVATILTVLGSLCMLTSIFESQARLYLPFFLGGIFLLVFGWIIRGFNSKKPTPPAE